MVKYTRNKTIDIASPASKVLKLLQDKPIQFLDLIGVKVEETLSNPIDDGREWLVTEKMSVPLIPSIHFKTRFTLLEEGSRWESWAPFGIYVDSNLTVTTSISKKQRDGLPNEQHEEAPTCQAVEVAVLSCPSFLYPYVRWQFDKSHEKNLSSIKQFIENNH